MFSTAMKINEKNVVSFAASDSPVDKEGYLSKKNDVKGFQRRWFVLKGNLLFYYEKKQDKEPAGLVVLESYSVQASATEKHGFEISFDGPGTRTYVLAADNDEDMQSWMRAISHASYEFLRGIVNELQKQVDVLTSRSTPTPPPKPARPPDGKVPILPKPKTKVENGVLVDVSDAPPVPPKRRSLQASESSDPSSSTISTLPSVVPYHPIPPHTNPVVVPSSGKGPEPLSPSSTLDRTPILLPTITSEDYDVPPPPIPAKGEHSRGRVSPQVFQNTPSSHDPSTSTRVNSSSKDIYSIHQELSDAIRGSSAERTVTDSVS